MGPPILPSLSRHIVNYLQQCGKETCPGNSFTLKDITFEPTTSLAVLDHRSAGIPCAIGSSTRVINVRARSAAPITLTLGRERLGLRPGVARASPGLCGSRSGPAQTR